MQQSFDENDFVRRIKHSYQRHCLDIANRGGSRAAATSKMKCIVNGFQPLSVFTKHSILDVAAALDPPLANAPNEQVKANL